jgi:hypothetical protein
MSSYTRKNFEVTDKYLHCYYLNYRISLIKDASFYTLNFLKAGSVDGV